VAKAFLRGVRSRKRRLALSDVAGESYKEVARVMDQQVKPALVEAHERVVKDWDSDVGFAAKKFLRRDSITVYVYPTGEDKEVWGYVDLGTRPHKIRAKNAPRLAFMMSVDAAGKFVRGGYVPKTLAKPARTVLGGGYVKSPKALARPIEVDHPGSEGRGFTEQIAREMQPEIETAIENAFRRIARRTCE
jgi:hypothetical protein